jgi:protein-disulfide isomerase
MGSSPWVPRIVLGAIAVLLAGIVYSVAVGESGPPKITLQGEEQVQQLIGGIAQDGPYLGSQDAPVTIQVFNDLQAPSGAAFELRTVDPLIEAYVRTGKARVELRHFSFTSQPTNLAAYAAAAAGVQDREWQYADLFFRNQDQAPHGTVTDEFLRDIANADEELDADRWQKDLDAPRIKKQVEADGQLATDLRLTAAPAVIVTGPSGQKQLEDTPSLSAIETAISSVE